MPNLIYDKCRYANQAVRPRVGSVLDVGCRYAILMKHSRGDIASAGTYLIPGAGVDCAGNAEEGLFFPEVSFNAVAAIDLQEQDDRKLFVFGERTRVVRRQVVVVPIASQWLFRLQYFCGQVMDEYCLPPESILDRYCSRLSPLSVRRFCRERAARRASPFATANAKQC